MLRVLIATYPGDIHATAVAVGLQKLGHCPVLLHGADFPTKQRGSIAIEGRSFSWRMSGEEIDECSSPFDVVWLRRPKSPNLPTDMHAGDRKLAERACVAFYRAFWNLVAKDAFWINPLSSRNADIKPLQLIEAAQVGLSIPPTLCSNDPDEIRTFLNRYRGETVYKSFTPAQWEIDDGVAYLFTSPVGLEDLPDDDLLQVTAGIFQRKIDKKYELRITAIGERLFAAKLHSQQNDLARDDWRRAFNTLRFEAMELPADISRRCRELMKRLGIVFGCFDFIVTSEDEYIFLEVNPMGQFLWVEEGDPSILLTDAFCQLIVQRRSDFAWSPSAGSLRFADLRAAALEVNADASRRHVKPEDHRLVKDDFRSQDLEATDKPS